MCHAALGHGLAECVESKAKHRVATATSQGQGNRWGCYHMRWEQAKGKKKRSDRWSWIFVTTIWWTVREEDGDTERHEERRQVRAGGRCVKKKEWETTHSLHFTPALSTVDLNVWKGVQFRAILIILYGCEWNISESSGYFEGKSDVQCSLNTAESGLSPSVSCLLSHSLHFLLNNLLSLLFPFHAFWLPYQLQYVSLLQYFLLFSSDSFLSFLNLLLGLETYFNSVPAINSHQLLH